MLCVLEGKKEFLCPETVWRHWERREVCWDLFSRVRSWPEIKQAGGVTGAWHHMVTSEAPQQRRVWCPTGCLQGVALHRMSAWPLSPQLTSTTSTRAEYYGDTETKTILTFGPGRLKRNRVGSLVWINVNLKGLIHPNSEEDKLKKYIQNFSNTSSWIHCPY